MSIKQKYQSFEEARAFVQSLKLGSQTKWNEWAKTNARPKDIPSHAAAVYKKEWKGWGDFLGTGRKGPQDHNFLPFKEARAYAQSLRLKTGKEWTAWVKTDKRPENIPACPFSQYRHEKEWKGMGDFLGTGRKGPQNYNFLSFKEARAYAQSLGLKTGKEWQKWAKTDERPENIPANPSSTYRSEWVGWGDFLRNGQKIPKTHKFLPFKEARAYAQSLELKTWKEWVEWAKTDRRPENIPASPVKVYKEEWKGIGDFLGTGQLASQNRYYRPFEEVCVYARSLGIKTSAEWFAFTKTDAKPEDIPANVGEVYKKEWRGFGSFLGTNRKAPKDCKFRPFEEARTYIQSLGIESGIQWAKWSKTDKKPEDIPADPSFTYQKDWKGWGDFLGTGRKAPKDRQYRSFKEARAYVRKLGLKTGKEWVIWAKTDAKPEDIPADIAGVYKEEWKSWGDFLGTGNKGPQDHNYLPFKEARAYAQSLKFKSRNHWTEWAKTDERPENVPAGPSGPYKDEWKGWGDFLGTGRIPHKDRIYRSFEEARTYVQSLKFESQANWNEWARTDARPIDIPSHPSDIYKDEWLGWGDWCGYKSIWSVNAIKAFIKSLLPYIDGLTPPEMYVLLQQNGLLGITNYSKGKKFIEALKSGKFPKEELEKFAQKQSSTAEDIFSDVNLYIDAVNENLQTPEHAISEEQLTDDQLELPIISTIDVLTTVDSNLLSNLDEEAVDYFIKSAVAKIWKHTYLDEAMAIHQLEYHDNKGLYSQKVKALFLSEYNGAKELLIPTGYSSPLTPNLMQRHTAYLVKDRKKLGNWSGTGSGKTLSAILASRVINAKLTVICCPNNVISNWEKRIPETYPQSVVLRKSANLEKLDTKSLTLRNQH